MSLISIFMAMLASASPAPVSFARDAQSACEAPLGTSPSIAGIRVENIPAMSGDLPHLHIVDEVSGGWMNAYFDTISAKAARARAACLGAELRLVAESEGGFWKDAQWYSVTFTADPNYVPPRDGKEKRWSVTTGADGSLGRAAQTMLVVTMPHEQVHAFQQRNTAVTPRWFHEGHAEWIGRAVSAKIAPAEARAHATLYADALTMAKEPVALGAWGGMHVTREAIMKQASAADRDRMQTDPSFTPAGPFHFGPGDIVSDESNVQARYEAAWRLFRDLERRHGTKAVNLWVLGLTAQSGTLTAKMASDSAQSGLGEDLTERLR